MCKNHRCSEVFASPASAPRMVSSSGTIKKRALHALASDVLGVFLHCRHALTSLHCRYAQVSFIPRDGNCKETTILNPKTRPLGSNMRVSGHIAVNAADGSLPQEQIDSWLLSTFPGFFVQPRCFTYWLHKQQSRAPCYTLLLNANYAQRAGILQMCLKEDDALGFLPTGILLALQDNVLGLEVNGLTPNKWCVDGINSTNLDEPSVRKVII